MALRFSRRLSALVVVSAWATSSVSCEANSRPADTTDHDEARAQPDGAVSLPTDAGARDGAVRGDSGQNPLGNDGSLSDASREHPPAAPFAHRARSISIGIENVNDSPMKDAAYRALLRFVPMQSMTIDRFYFGFKLKGAECWPADAGYGAGDGGTLEASLVHVDPHTGLPGDVIDRETVNACTRHSEAGEELGSNPVLVWANTQATLEAGVMYALIVRNVHDDPAQNFFSFNMPLADSELAGPHARNELSGLAAGSILSLDLDSSLFFGSAGAA